MSEIDLHQKFMRIAIKLADQNVKKAIGGPFGAVIVKNGKIIAKSGNKVTLKNDPTAHAEVSAIRIACRKLETFDLQGCVIYTSCEPCPMCLSAIYWAHLDEVYYANTKEDAADIGFDDQFIYKEIALPFKKRRLPFCQLMRSEALHSFKLWDASTMKMKY
jgi:guanine deaminase